MKKLFLLLAIGGLTLTSCGSKCMGKGVNFADTEEVKSNYIVAEDAACTTEVY